jgi:short-subunit dehydrogenase
VSPWLRGRTALVTGASAGIGAATARELARRGVRVALVARRIDRVEEVAAEFRREGGEAAPLAADLADPAAVAGLRERVERAVGPVDLLVQNAARGMFGAFAALDRERLRQVFELNVFAPVELTNAFLPGLRERRGRVVFVSSVVAYRAPPWTGAYAASKAALNALAEALRFEVHPDGVKVIVVSPGLTATEFRAVAPSADGTRRPPPKRFAASPEAVARAIVRAAERGSREVVLGVGARSARRANQVAPGLVDAVVRAVAGKPPTG